MSMQRDSSQAHAAPPDYPGALYAPLNYLAPGLGLVHIRVYPPASGLPNVRPAALLQTVAIHDMRPVASQMRLDEAGFEFHTAPTAFADFYNEAAVCARYYPEVQATLRGLTKALEVIAFDHNVRSSARAARGEAGVRVPAEQVHNDYTERSGPKRRREILETAGRTDLMDRHFAFVNLWRPIIGPVRDNPLAVCDVRSVQASDFVVTEIQHFGEHDLEKPRHIGEIYSTLYRPQHQWYYVSEMQPQEVLLLKCYDSRRDGRARFMPHSGFQNPSCPADFVPRESIEVRTLVVYDQRI
jgi:hypothetical protein